MRAAVVDVGEMRVAMGQPRVGVNMRVRLPGRIAGTVRMLVMRVMQMAVLVHHRLVQVLVTCRIRQREQLGDFTAPAAAAIAGVPRLV